MSDGTRCNTAEAGGAGSDAVGSAVDNPSSAERVAKSLKLPCLQRAGILSIKFWKILM
jgi:hypothetical protein